MEAIQGPPAGKTFGKDQQVYTWNGLLRCVFCNRITNKGQCPHECPFWVALGFDIKTGIGHCADCSGQIVLGSPQIGAKGQAIHPQADNFTIFSLNTADGIKGQLVCDPCGDVRLDEKIDRGDLRQAVDETGFRNCDDCHERITGGQQFTLYEFDDGRTEITCYSCSNIRLDEDIAQGKFLYSPDTDSWFSPRQFPDKTGYKIGDLLPPDEEHPTYRAIEASIENGAAFQCSYCGITDDISELDYTHSGLDRCKTCQDKHEAYKPEAAQLKAFDEE